MDSNIATVYIDVTNEAPWGMEDEYSTINDVELVVTVNEGVLQNDGDFEGDPLTAVLFSDATYGTVSLAADGSFTYTPTLEYLGFDTFLYRIFDGLAYSTAIAVNVARNEFYIRLHNPTGQGQPIEMDPTTISTVWVGEWIVLDVEARGPKPPAMASYSWTIPGDKSLGYTEGPIDPNTGLPTSLQWDYPSQAYLQNKAIGWMWLFGPNGPADIYEVSVSVTVPGMAPIDVGAKFRVKTPLISVLADTSQVMKFTIPGLSTMVRAGDPDHPTNPHSGIEVNTTVVDGPTNEQGEPAGEVFFIQTINNITYAEFAGDPGGFANPNFGPGPYSIYVSGIDWIKGGNSFDDSPSIPVPESGAGATSFVNHEASFELYVMWQFDAPGAWAVPVRVIEWGWTFSMSAVPDGMGGFDWGPLTNDSIYKTVNTPSAPPEWNGVGKPPSPPWSPAQ